MGPVEARERLRRRSEQHFCGGGGARSSSRRISWLSKLLKSIGRHRRRRAELETSPSPRGGSKYGGRSGLGGRRGADRRQRRAVGQLGGRGVRGAGRQRGRHAGRQRHCHTAASSGRAVDADAERRRRGAQRPVFRRDHRLPPGLGRRRRPVFRAAGHLGGRAHAPRDRPAGRDHVDSAGARPARARSTRPASVDPSPRRARSRKRPPPRPPRNSAAAEPPAPSPISFFRCHARAPLFPQWTPPPPPPIRRHLEPISNTAPLLPH